MYTPVPVLLLTGYLGSGKTTLLNRILSNTEGIRFAVIVNDLGEVNIDADLIQKGGVVSQQDDNLVALQNGCICCTLKMDLISQLHDLCAQHAFDYIVIEASGICEPAPIAQTICSYPQMVPQFVQDGLPRLDCIVTVVDALRMRDEFGSGEDLRKHDLGEEDLASLVIQQIEFCNLILLNKADEVSPEDLDHIRAIIRAIQPKADIVPCNYCDVPLSRMLETGLFDFDRVATSATWIREVEDALHHEEDEDDEHEHEHHHHEEHDHDHEEEHEHHHHHHHHHDEEGEAEEYGISTFVYFARRPFNLGLFDEFVATHWPKNVIRAKGMCYFSDEYDMCYLFEQAGQQFGLKKAGEWFATMPAEELERMKANDPQLRHDWDEQYGDRMQKLVFIGQHMDKAAITQALDRCLE
ncbi:MAG: GTP-binding protein [Paludibacteraceae bacterium]|nr:GTP-binding protein [Paludibacteraceae bacterium]